MEIISIILVAISLSFDTFSVSLTAGVGNAKMKLKSMLTFPLTLAIFQGGFFLLGGAAGSKFLSTIEHYDHWIAFALLLLIGGKMILESLKKDNGDANINFFAIRNEIIIAISTSIDALTVGIAYMYYKSMPMTYSALIVAFTTFLFSVMGLMIGKYLGKKINFKFDIIGGIILILIGIKILITHTA